MATVTNTAHPACDREQVRLFLADVLGDAIHLVAIDPRAPRGSPASTRGQWFGKDASAAASWAEDWNMRGWNVYWTVNVAREGLNKKPAKTDIVAVRFAHVDADPPKDGSPWSLETKRSEIQGHTFPPSLVIASGGGVGAFWRLDDNTTADTVERINQGLCEAFGGDACWNVDRLMRPPGVVNWPDKVKIARGRQPVLAAVLDPDDGVTYPVHALVSAFQPVERDRRERAKVEIEGDVQFWTADDLGLGLFDPLRSLIDRPQGRDRSGDALACAGHMARGGYSDAQIYGVLMNPANAVHAHIGDHRDPRYAALRCIQLVRGDAGENPSASGVGSASDQPVGSLPLIDPADWDGVATPPREWMMDDWMPRASCTYLTGVGASGKSLLTQQICTSMALGLDVLGVPVRQTIAVYITCEDTADELHRRQAAINAALGIRPSVLRDKLKLISLKGLLGNELAIFDASGRMSTTPRWQELLATVRSVGAGFVALDNVAHLFAGDENNRHQVAAFTGLVDRLAIEINGAVLLLGHPNKAGAEFSGSTAWENQVRSRLYLALDDGENGIADRDVRILTRSKPNYAQRGEAIKFRWHQWAFLRPEDLPANVHNELALTVEATAENVRFLECLDKLTAEKRNVSHSPNAANYAPKAMAKMTEANGMRKPAFERAMNRLFSRGQIEAGATLWIGADRKPVTGIARKQVREGAGRSSGNPQKSLREGSAETCGEVREGHAESGRNPCGPVRDEECVYINISGAAPDGPAAPVQKGVGAPRFPAPPQRVSGIILAPGESLDDPVPGWN